MHENLKYTINLDKDTIALKHEELLTVKGELDKNQKRQIADWQPVFSDTNYGTRFLVYAKFIGKRLGTDSFEISLIQFYLQNYAGNLSIGFNGYFDLRQPPVNVEDPDMMDSKFPSRSKYVLDIGLQGFNTDFVKKDFKPKTPLTIKAGDILQCKSLFTPVDSSYSNIFDEKNFGKAKFVDELFMERNGDEIFITSEGESKLRSLESKYQLVDEAKLLSGGIDKNVQQNYKTTLEKRGRVFPCEPKSSIFIVL